MSLSKKELRDAQPLEQLPFRVQRRYGEPKLISTFNGVRAELSKDVNEVKDLVHRLRCTAEDRDRVATLEVSVAGLTEDSLPVFFDVLIDEYSGLRYQVAVTDRRKA